MTTSGDTVMRSGDGCRLSMVRSRADVLRSQLAERAGHLHVANAALVGLRGELDACAGWKGAGTAARARRPAGLTPDGPAAPTRRHWAL